MEDWLRKEIGNATFFSDEPMDRHTSFRVGGKAEIFVEIESKEQLIKLSRGLKEHAKPYFILGNGSNLLVSDKGYSGCILHMGEAMSSIRVEGEKIYAQAGALLSQVAAFALKNSLTGLEFASGIPGSVGGAMVMNAGAYDGEMSMVTDSVLGVTEDGQEVTISGKEMNFGYRTSLLKEKKIVCTEACFLLKSGEKEKIKEKMDDFSERRRQKQPLEYPSAGSTFKRPKGYFAGKLIMDAGLSGYRIGGAMVSPKHCGFVINTGNATAQDVHSLIQYVQKKVMENANVKLEPEVIRLGEF